MSNCINKSKLKQCFSKLLFFFNQHKSVLSALKEMKRAENEVCSSNTKICVKPNPKKASTGENMKIFSNNFANMLPTFLKDTSFEVYFYDEWRMEAGLSTGFKFPKELVDETKKRLNSKKALKQEIKNNNDDGFEAQFKKYLKLKEIESQFKPQ